MTSESAWHISNSPIGLPPPAVKKRDAAQHHSVCPSTGGTCCRARSKRLCWGWVWEGVATSCSGGPVRGRYLQKIIWNFRCKFLPSGAFSARKLTAKAQNTFSFQAVLRAPITGNTKSWITGIPARITTVCEARKRLVATLLPWRGQVFIYIWIIFTFLEVMPETFCTQSVP